MKNIIMAVTILAIAGSSCSSAYKATRTPDDVYYSPAPAAKPGEDDRYDDYTSSNDENYLRMKVRNRYQWDGLDDYSYWNDSRYDFGYGCTPSRSVLLNPYNPYWAGNFMGYYYTPWGNFYSPFYTIVYYKNPRVYYGNTSKTNLTAYRNRNYNNNNFGNLLKQAFNSSNNTTNNNNNSLNPTRSFSSGSTQSNSAGGRSGGYNSSGSSSGSTRAPRGGGK
ncbi:hypothetical protein [Limnovirga soli]|uniref:Lipoprotein n=1 Tax=Limnovirga soli TaxID=2656915 RepID=A0A8J8FG68_9BACT|nr:hypothetical protein [Limnovirga soli]NNV55784.1 hypothetical protein [Limnovirga soli]